MIVPSFGLLATETVVAAAPEELPEPLVAAVVAAVVLGWLEDVELLVELPPQPAMIIARALSDRVVTARRG